MYYTVVGYDAVDNTPFKRISHEVESALVAAIQVASKLKKDNRIVITHVFEGMLRQSVFSNSERCIRAEDLAALNPKRNKRPKKKTKEQNIKDLAKQLKDVMEFWSASDQGDVPTEMFDKAHALIKEVEGKE